MSTIDDGMPVVDSHYHIWDLDQLRYPWLEQVGPHLMGDYTSLCENYTAADFRRDHGPVHVVQAVHVEAACSDALGETQWLEQVAESSADGMPQAIVAAADLSRADVDQQLAAQAAHPRVRGIRQILNHHPDERLTFAERDLLQDAEWRRGFARLQQHGLSFDLQLYPHQVSDALCLAADHSETLLLINNAGTPIATSGAEWQAWKQGMADLARADNTVMKIAGFGMTFHDWTVADLRPLIDHLLTCFGPERVLFGSNYPVDRLGGDYPSIWRAFDICTADLSADERRLMFHDNAVRYYRLDAEVRA